MTVFAAASPPSPTLLARLEELNFRVVHVYGLTETYGPITVSPEPDGFDELDAVGRARVLARQGQAYPTADLVRVVDEHDADVARDGATMGEVVMRGNNVMLGYHDDPEGTALAFRGGWFHSGDLAVWHPDGTVELRDRAKDVIISGGENISTIEVEQALASHPAVLECAVVAVPHEHWGERPKAFVTLREGAEVTAEELIEHVRGLHRALQGARRRRVRPAAEDLDRQGAEVRPARSRVGRPRGADQLAPRLRGCSTSCSAASRSSHVGAEVGRLLLQTRRDDPERFVRDVKDVLLDERVRFHVKDSVLAVVRALPDPSEAELEMVLDLLADEAWRARVATVLPEPPWFDLLEDSGTLAGWLGSGDSKLEQRAVWVIGMAGSARPGRAGELLAPLADRPDFVKWLPWVAQTIDLAADRRFFEAFLGALRRGQLDEYELGLFSAVLSLGESAPAWLVEVLSAWLVERPGAHGSRRRRGRRPALGERRSVRADPARAEGAPEEFAERLLPYMQQVMALTEQGDAIPRPDLHFSGGMLAREVEHIEKMLMPAMGNALDRGGRDEPRAAARARRAARRRHPRSGAGAALRGAYPGR